MRLHAPDRPGIRFPWPVVWIVVVGEGALPGHRPPAGDARGARGEAVEGPSYRMPGHACRDTL